MRDTPNFGFNRNPRFSVNHVAEYLCTTTAAQREAVIRSAKFPRKPAVIPYTQSKRIISEFLCSNTGDVSALDAHIERLDGRHRREPDGWMRDELKRNIAAIEAFKTAFVRARCKRYTFTPGPVDLGMNVEGVRINVRMDVALTETSDDDVMYSGGCVLFVANTDQARKNIEDRRKHVGGLVYWGLSGGNIEPIPRLCLSFDVFGNSVIKASGSTDRFRENIHVACREVGGIWDRVKPPAGYDGPDWQ